MDTFDAKLEKRVWQRVRGEESVDPAGSLRGLAAREWTEAAVYLMLSRQMQGREKTMLRRLFEEEQAHGACLRGIYALTAGEPLNIRTQPPAPEPPETALRKCYGRELQAAEAYSARTQDPEYGAVFAKMAEQEREHCRMILELLGNLRK
jgi:rubrerythrin